MTASLFDRTYGALLGGTLGDTIGALTECMTTETIDRVFGRVTGPVAHKNDRTMARFTPGADAGYFTDDTRMRRFIVDAICSSGRKINADDFGHYMAAELDGQFFAPVINSYFKMVVGGTRPREAGRGNMGSNTTAMAIAPIGIVNPGDPRSAANEAYSVASVIHEGYALDAAACVAAAVASAFNPANSVDDVIADSLRYLDRQSPLHDAVRNAVEVAKNSQDFAAFRIGFRDNIALEWPQTDFSGGREPTLEGFYDTAEPRESVPAALALLVLTGGDPKEGILAAANLGRDADTIGSMVGSIAGAMAGYRAIPADWIAIHERANDVPEIEYAQRLYEVVQKELVESRARLTVLESQQDQK